LPFAVLRIAIRNAVKPAILSETLDGGRIWTQPPRMDWRAILSIVKPEAWERVAGGSRWRTTGSRRQKSASRKDASISTQYFRSHLNSIRINNLFPFPRIHGHFCNSSGVCGVIAQQSGGVAGAKPPATLFQAFGLRLSRNVPLF
jgi:hypothetical protein